MIKLKRNVKIRKQRETLLMSIPKPIAEMMDIKKGDTAVVTYEGNKLIVEVIKDNE